MYLGNRARAVFVPEGEDVAALGLEGEKVTEVVHLQTKTRKISVLDVASS